MKLNWKDASWNNASIFAVAISIFSVSYFYAGAFQGGGKLVAYILIIPAYFYLLITVIRLRLLTLEVRVDKDTITIRRGSFVKTTLRLARDARFELVSFSAPGHAKDTFISVQDSATRVTIGRGFKNTSLNKLLEHLGSSDHLNLHFPIVGEKTIDRNF